jgi:uncharacterized membrane protein
LPGIVENLAGGHLEFGAEPWLIATAILGFGLSVGLLWWADRRSRTPAGILPNLLSTLAAGTLAAAVTDPRWVEEEGAEEGGRLVVLVDASASMGVEENGQPRSTAVAPLLERLAAEGALEIYHFDGELHPGAPSAWTGRSTDLGAALGALSDRFLGESLRGVVLLTDGLDRGGLRETLREAASRGPLSPTLAPTLPGPLTVYQIGSGVSENDLAIVDVKSAGFAFLRSPFRLQATLRGAPHRTLPLRLHHEGRLVAETSVTLDEQGKGQAEFSITPKTVGRYIWELSVPVDPGDPLPGNNHFPVVVRVVRDRMRVLQVSGSPSQDQKFLRLFLKEDPSVDLVSFFILRNVGDEAGWDASELALIQFPYERLFSEDLASFDLVILQNFNYGPYFDYDADALLGNIAEYVRTGGALAMTGGTLSFDLAGYGETPLAPVLPVRLGLEGIRHDESPFRPKVTEAGLAHPLTRLGSTPEETRAIWERLPALDGMNLSKGGAAEAAVLLEHPTLRTPDGSPQPVLAVAEMGEGRTMALSVDASWRWAFSEAASGRGNQAYLRFWKNALRWLVADPEDRRVVLTPTPENGLLGEEVRISVKVRDPAYGPAPGVVLEGLIQGPDGKMAPLNLTTDASGEAWASYTPQLPGAYTVEVRAGARSADQSRTVFAISTRDPELDEIAADGSFLASLAALYGDSGRYVGPGGTEGPLLDPKATRLRPDRTETHLGHLPVVGLFFGLLSSFAWWLRRRAGAA